MASVNLVAVQREFEFPDWMITMNLPSTIAVADIGKAVTIDTSADMQAKLCGANDKILGRLEAVEIRVQDGLYVGTIALKFIGVLPSTGTINRGDSVVGSATAGSVKAATPITATALAGDVPSYNSIALSAAASSLVNVAFGL